VIFSEKMSWREAGISYLRYLSIATKYLHSVQKDGPLLTKNIRFSTVGWLAMIPDPLGGVKEVTVVPAGLDKVPDVRSKRHEITS